MGAGKVNIVSKSYADKEAPIVKKNVANKKRQDLH